MWFIQIFTQLVRSNCQISVKDCRRRALVFNARNSGSSGLGSCPIRDHCILFFSTQVCKWVQANKFNTGDIVDDRLASHGGGSRNTLMHLMLRKPTLARQGWYEPTGPRKTWHFSLGKYENSRSNIIHARMHLQRLFVKQLVSSSQNNVNRACQENNRLTVQKSKWHIWRDSQHLHILFKQVDLPFWRFPSNIYCGWIWGLVNSLCDSLTWENWLRYRSVMGNLQQTVTWLKVSHVG